MSDLRRYAGLWTTAYLLLGAGLCTETYLALRKRRPAPPTPVPVPGAVAAAARASAAPRCTREHYQQSLAAAARSYQVPPVTVDAMRQPLRGGVEFRGARVLEGKHRRLKTAHLSIEAQVADLVAQDGSSERVPHLVLSIQNLSKVPLAYRVLTRVPAPEGCGNKQDLPHDALVIKPRETIRRSECIAAGRAITVTQVEVYEVTPLGQAFLSRQEPYAGGPFDLRVAAAHDRRGLSPCTSWEPAGSGPDDWRRLVDFFARHDCDEYKLPKDYRPFEQPGFLPVCTSGAP